MPPISIIIPMYNVEKYLRRCLDSVKNQTFQDWTAICVNDGSPDTSSKIAAEYAAADERFIVVDKENGGLSDARNVGMSYATGDYLMFLDSDDCIHPQTLEIVHTLATHHNVDMVCFQYNRSERDINMPCDKMPEYFSQRYNTRRVKFRKTNNLMCYATNADKGANSFWAQQCFIPMRLYRRSILSGLYFKTDIKLLEDFVYWAQVLRRRPSAVITNLDLYYYTLNPGSLLHSGNGINGLVNVINAVRYAAHEYMDKIDTRNAKIWHNRFLWSILSRVCNSTRRIKSSKDRQRILKMLSQLRADGIIDCVHDLHSRRYRRRILRLLDEK